RRPDTTTAPCASLSIVNIRTPIPYGRHGGRAPAPRIPQRDAALAAHRVVLVFDRIRHSPDQVHAEATRLARLDRRLDVDRRPAGRIEGLDIAIDQRDLD